MPILKLARAVPAVKAAVSTGAVQVVAKAVKATPIVKVAAGEIS